MPISPKTPSALLRSLGPDESAMEAKLRVSAREAEQRWPLFRALAPTKAEAPAPMSDTDKQAWEQAASPAAATRKPLLTRPGLSSKLSAGLERFAAAPLTPKKAAKSVKDTPPTDKEVHVASAVRASTKAQATPSQPADHPQSSGLFASAQPDVPRKTLFAPPPPTIAPTPTKGSLFANKTSQPTTQHATDSVRPATPEDSARVARGASEPSADDSLAAVFNRVEGKMPAAPTAQGGRVSSVMRRIGKR